MQYTLLTGDAMEQLQTLPDCCVDVCVTSPPYYGLRDYGMGDNQIGLEKTPKDYVEKLVSVFREVKRVLKNDGVLWVNIGDSYNASGHGRKADGTVHFSEKSAKQSTNAGSGIGLFKKTLVDGCKPKDLIGIPWMLAFALRADGWYLRQDIIWAKKNPMPESVKDRCTRSHEYIFMLTKNMRYYFNHEAIQEPAVTNDTYKRDRDNTKMNNTPGRSKMGGLITNNYKMRNKRDVWTVGVCSTVKEAHFAVFPQELIEPCILSSCPVGGTVLDPFSGSGTSGIVAMSNDRSYIGIDLNPEYHEIAERRIQKECTNVFIVEKRL